LALGWLREGVIDGLRIDHPDGLRDPEGYFWRLRDAQPTAWIVAEKILTGDEQLPATWPVDGTVGYEFISQVTRLLMHPDGETPLTDFYVELTGCAADFASVVRDAKDLVLHDLLGSELNRLTALLLRICEQHRGFRDYTRHEVHQALRELLACFPAYRSYARPETGAVTDFDRQCVETAVEQAKTLRPDMDVVLVDFIRDILLLRIRGEAESELACRFQQLSGSVMAKGVEDTAFYNFNRLVALNEVGNSPDRFTIDLDEFHDACARTLKHWPRTLLATSTHDTKRSEDVRARLAVLSEIPDRWTAAVRGWVLHNERHRRDGMPDRNTEYLFYQTLVGAWPIDRERALAYMQKAIREAKRRTSWTAPNAEFEEAVNAFVVDVLADRAFADELQAFVDRLAEPGRVNSLAQLLLKMTAPGVPDIYQGSELWDLSLVDPDNRRDVDFQRRGQLLAELTDVTPEAVLARTDEGLPKLWVIKQALALRRARPRAFGPEGTYEPLRAEGTRAAHVVAFVRGEEVLTLVPRWPLRLGGDWDDTRIDLPAGRWRHLFSGDLFATGPTTVHALLSRFPVCLLARDNDT
jgi:(1->4)-alpha-D-glucan 1-alpha-D-glucosylmutase